MTGDEQPFVARHSYLCHFFETPLMRFRIFFALLAFPLLSCVLVVRSEVAVIPGKFESLGPFGGDVRSLLIDFRRPRIVYAGTSNGMIFKSLDSGKSWFSLYPGIGRQALVIDTLVEHPTEPDHIYAGAWDLHSDGGGLYESRDAGSRWSRMMLPKPDSAVRGLSICMSKPSFMIIGTLDGAFVTADAGRNWKQVGGAELQKAESVAIDPFDSSVLYVGTWRLAYKSSDFGKTWDRISAGMPLDSDVFSFAIDRKNPEIVYSSACSGVYRSANKARNWTRLKLLPDRFTVRAQVVYIDSTNPGRIYSGTTEGLFTSADNGRHWKRITSSGVTVNAVQVNPENGDEILIGTEYKGILSSRDGGRTWKESNQGFIHRQISWLRSYPEPTGLFAGLGSGSGGLFSYNTMTKAWTSSEISPGVRILSFLVLPKRRGVLAGTTQGLFWQAEESRPWVKLKGLIAKRTILSLECDPINLVVYAGTDRGIYRTSVAALDFRFPPESRFSPQAWCITVPAAGDGAVYAGTSLGLLRSWDRGTTWSVVSSYGMPERVTIHGVAVSPLDGDQLFAATSAGLFESKDGGIGWRRAGDGSIGLDIPSVIFPDGSGLRIAALEGDSGTVFYSKDKGKNWEKLSPQSSYRATCLVRDTTRASRIFIGTRYSGVYQLELP
jgi:photosystem II stability/assembly factor-like uncharacterized protein